MASADDATFYDRWIDAEAQVRRANETSPVVVHDAEVPWEETRQDARAKLIFGRELGLPTMGGALVKAEIPTGWQTGRHRHGEESIFFMSGEGATRIGSEWFRWRAGTAMLIPYRAEHQHFNLGEEPVTYLSATATPLEAFLHLGGVDHLEDHGPLNQGLAGSIPSATSHHLSSGRRVSINLDEAPTDPGDDPDANLPANRNQHDLEQFLVHGRNGFEPSSVAITHLFTEPAGFKGGRHRHLEAVLYIVDGNGFTNVEDRTIPWAPGDVMHIPPAMFAHQHYNDGQAPCRMLRIAFGIRRWVTSLWPEGYETRRVVDDAGNPMLAGSFRQQT
jgi:mannose-6-phosphate isomerase-like protein (cupin superfamily)